MLFSYAIKNNNLNVFALLLWKWFIGCCSEIRFFYFCCFFFGIKSWVNVGDEFFCGEFTNIYNNWFFLFSLFLLFHTHTRFLNFIFDKFFSWLGFFLFFYYVSTTKGKKIIKKYTTISNLPLVCTFNIFINSHNKKSSEGKSEGVYDV